MDPTSPIDPNLQALIVMLGSVPGTAKILPWMPLVCIIAMGIDAVFPPPPAGSIWVWPRRVVHILAGNFGNARNAVPAGAIPAPVALKAAEAKEAADTAVLRAGELAQATEGQPEAARPKE